MAGENKTSDMKAYLKEWRKRNAERVKAYNEANAERRAKQTADWLAAHPEQRRAYSQKFRDKNPDYLKNWRKQNREKARQHSEKWRSENHDKWRESANRARQKHRLEHPDREHARSITADAIRTGKLIRPNACSRCGIPCSPHAHHPNYSKPLEVIWLCEPCHRLEHGQNPSSQAINSSVQNPLHAPSFVNETVARKMGHSVGCPCVHCERIRKVLSTTKPPTRDSRRKR
jgi:hypothetical protein